MFTSLARENMALTLSAAGAGLFAVVGIGWGLWVDSLVILFDGAYSLISLALSLLSLYAARLVHRPATEDYPFGLGAVEPMVIAVKGLVIALVCVLSLASAVVSLLQGGRAVAADMAMVFGAVNVVGCLAVWVYLRWSSFQNNSGLVRAEQRQWLMDSALSAAVMIGFAAAWILEKSQWSELAVYADPVMMLVISVYFMTVPVKMILESVRELLLAAPSEDAMGDIQDTLEDLGLNSDNVKVAKLGPNLLLEARMVRI
ncbi:MAG: cation diffusion facilitator family transporter [Alteromonadaceae bacterium]|nr:cation diffusion facilitator family transporter [Alteromonadaceae bacterium]